MLANIERLGGRGSFGLWDLPVAGGKRSNRSGSFDQALERLSSLERVTSRKVP